MLTQDQISEFQDRGFILVPDFLTPDQTKALQGEVARLQAEGKLHNVSTDGDGKTHSDKVQNLQICPVSPHSELIHAIAYNEKVTTVVEELIGGPVRHILDQIFLKPAQHGAGTNWHQDNGYFKVEDPTKGVGMWIAVHAANIQNGTMHMAPGLQLTQLPHYRDPFSDHHIRCDVDESLEVACELPAGGAVFFGFGVPHCTKANRSDGDRAGLAFHFINDAHPTNDGHIHASKPLVTGPDADGGVAQFGKDLRGKF